MTYLQHDEDARQDAQKIGLFLHDTKIYQEANENYLMPAPNLKPCFTTNANTFTDLVVIVVIIASNTFIIISMLTMFFTVHSVT